MGFFANDDTLANQLFAAGKASDAASEVSAALAQKANAADLTAINNELGNIKTGIDREKQQEFLTRGHVNNKYECSTCWARPLCAGGCHHEAFVRYGDTGHANLHYCDWIRAWTDVCLRVYAEIADRNPAWLAQFDREPMAEKVS